MKLVNNGNSSQYAPVPLQVEDTDNNRASKEKKDAELAKENTENDFHMAPLAIPEESKEEVSEKVLPMTPLRKLCFVLSLLQCALFIIAFGWLIPCKLPRYFDQQPSIPDWSVTFPSYETVTVMDVSSHDVTGVLIIGFKNTAKNETSGIKGLHVKDGSVQWQLPPLPGVPRYLDCEHLDVDGDGIADCIVGFDHKSARIGAFNKSNGHTYWFLHSHQNTIVPSSVGKPVVGLDCDNDRTKEVIFPFTDSSGFYYLGTMSGLTGQILGTVNLTVCKKMPEILVVWNTTDSLSIVFMCDNGLNVNIRSVPANDLCENTTGLSFDKLDGKFLSRLDRDEIATVNIVLKDGVESLLTTTNRGKVMMHDEYQQLWLKNVALTHTFRAATSGRFGNSSEPDILIASGDAHVGSEVVVLNSTNGNIKHKFHLENVTVTSFISVSKAFGDTDALFLKVIEPAERTHSLNGSDDEMHTIFVNEKFLLLECTETGAYKIIVSTPSFTECQGNSCKPDVYTNQETGYVVDVDGDKEFELVFFGKTYSEPLGQTDQLRLVRLDNVVPSKSCTTCSCSS